MFSGLDITSEKKFRKSLAGVLAAHIKKLKETDMAFDGSNDWAFLQEIKGEFYAGVTSLPAIIDKCLKYRNTQPPPGCTISA